MIKLRYLFLYTAWFLLVLMILSSGIRFADAAVCASYTLNNDTGDVGRTTSGQKQAQPFDVSSDCVVDSVSVFFSANNTPTDDVQISIHADSSGDPGTLLETGSILDVTGSTPATYVSSFTGTLTLTTATQYWIVASRTGSLNDTNFYYWRIGNSSPPSYGPIKQYNGSTWASYGGGYYGRFSVDGHAPTPPTPPTATTTLALFLDSYGNTLVLITGALGFLAFALILLGIYRGIYLWITDAKKAMISY